MIDRHTLAIVSIIGSSDRCTSHTIFWAENTDRFGL